MAEAAGLMGRLGEFVLRRAIADAERWPGLGVSVNVSPVQIRDRAFVDVVSAVLSESGFEPTRLVLEVAEGALIENPEETAARLLELRALGVRLALDDFGSGYSSLGDLRRLPFDKVKIDRSFVAALDQSANGGVVIQALVTLGRALRHGRRDRRGRDRGAARAGEARGLQRDAGRPVREAGAARGDRAAVGRAEIRVRGRTASVALGGIGQRASSMA